MFTCSFKIHYKIEVSLRYHELQILANTHIASLWYILGCCCVSQFWMTGFILPNWKIHMHAATKMKYVTSAEKLTPEKIKVYVYSFWHYSFPSQSYLKISLLFVILKYLLHDHWILLGITDEASSHHAPAVNSYPTISICVFMTLIYLLYAFKHFVVSK